MKKTIGIITICNALNYGTHLQAYALYKILEERYDLDVKLLTNEKVLISRNFKFLKRKRPIVLLKKLFLLIRFWLFDKQLHSGESFANYDVVLIGSDELWNVNNKGLVHDGLFTAKNVNSKIIATYAISCNGCSSEQFTQIYGDRPLERIDYISVRDKSTGKLLDDLNKKYRYVLDPTFLFDFTPYTNENQKDIILIYGYWFTDDEAEQIISFSKKTGKKLVAIGNDFPWCPYYVGGNPFTFINYVKNAAYFITSTFHGCAIAIQTKANFVAFGRDNKKVLEILEDFNLSERNSSRIPLNAIFNKKIDYETVSAIINKKKEESLKFLDDVIVNSLEMEESI